MATPIWFWPVLAFAGGFALAASFHARFFRAGYVKGLLEAERIASHHNGDAANAIAWARREFEKRAP